MSKTFYITTPIYYVNDRPHIGHASTTVWADVQARYRRRYGKAFFLTGLDEHGTKVQQAAEKRGVPPQQHCDEMAPHFLDLWKALHIEYDDFVRTTQPRHKDIVQKILVELHQKGQIYKKKYTGWYSKTAEQFVTEKEMVDGRFPSHFGEVVELEEENYFFKMSEHQRWLVEYINSNSEWIQPENRKNEILGALQKPLEDLCISRPRARLSWGIPLPFDPEYVTYVWFDALVNYISIPGYGTNRFQEFWPADFHLIAKDILTPHAIYWPTMLHALGLEMPKCILAHGWWLFNREKMSKTLGNVVNPLDLIQKYGADAVRYFICRELLHSNDTDFTEERFLQRFNADLANDLGNLVNRTLNMIKRYRQEIPEWGPREASDEDLKNIFSQNLRVYNQEMEKVNYGSALEAVWKVVSRANRYVDENAPWKLAKGTEHAKRLDTVLRHLAETIYGVAVMIEPVMPQTARNIFKQMDLSDAPFQFSHKEGSPEAEMEMEAVLKSKRIQDPVPLFPRQQDEKKK